MTDGTFVTVGDGSNVKGVWVPGAEVSTPIRMIAPQTLAANELANLEDGEHVKDFVKTWTKRLDVFTRDGNNDADRILWNGRTYKVTQVDDRHELGVYIKLTLKRVG